MTTTRTLWTEFTGSWCDNCEIAVRTRTCPSCRQPMRPAKIRVEPSDVADDEWPTVLGGKWGFDDFR